MALTLVERAFPLLAGLCLDIGLYGSDIGLEFWTTLWHYSDINVDPVASEMEFTVILVEGFWPLTSVARGFRLVHGGVPGYVLGITKVCNIFD